MSVPLFALSFIGSFGNLSELYEDHIFSLSILRLLSSEATSLVFTLLGTNAHINNLRQIHNIKESLSTLISLNLIKKVDNRVVLNETFKNVLLKGFCCRMLDRSFETVNGTRFNTEGYPIAFLNGEESTMNNSDLSGISNAREISNAKLRSILESVTSSPTRIAGVHEILLFCKLIDSTGQITNQGFEFLLQNKKDQLWVLVINSIKYFSRNTLEEVELLLDLMEIMLKNGISVFSTRKFKNWYSFLDSLGIFSIISTEPSDQVDNQGRTQNTSTGKSVYFVINNTGLFDHVDVSSLKEKHLVLETNFKIYAYTTKSYEKSILALFSKSTYVLPNMIKAELDEEFIISAFQKGITSKQIIKYLKNYSESVPTNMINQICIWEQKQHRIKATNGYLYHNFLHLSDFQKVLKFIENKNALIFKDENKRLLVASEEIHEDVKAFIKDVLT